MNRRDLFLSTAKGALAAAFAGSWLFKGAQTVAQVVRGTPGAQRRSFIRSWRSSLLTRGSTIHEAGGKYKTE